MGLAEQESEGNDKEFITQVVAHMHDPAAPIFRVARLGERPYSALGHAPQSGCQLRHRSGSRPGACLASYRMTLRTDGNEMSAWEVSSTGDPRIDAAMT